MKRGSDPFSGEMEILGRTRHDNRSGERRPDLAAVVDLQDYREPERSKFSSAEPDEDRFVPPHGTVNAVDAARQRFPILHLDELEIGDDPIWLVEDLLPATGFGVVFGPPKSHKSFLLSDAFFHIAMGRRWAGKDVMQGAVVYVTGEGVDGFKRRLIAMRCHYEVEGAGVPFLFVPVAPDLGHDSGDDLALVEAIRTYLATIGDPPVRAIAIDTLARTMRGADENAAKDMTVFVDNCERIGRAFGALVIGVHHAGKDVGKGSRGSNALDGAVDVMWSVEKGDGFSTATIHHMKDAESGISWRFRLQPMVLREATATSKVVAAATVEIFAPPGEAQQTATSPDRLRLGDRPKMLLKIIREAIGEMGQSIMGDVHIPHDAKSISRENLKRYLPLRGYWDEDKPSNINRATFSADLKTLSTRGVIGLNDRYVWFNKGQG